MRERLEALARQLRDEQRELIVAAAGLDTPPSQSTMQRVALLELNIAAIENTLHEDRR